MKNNAYITYFVGLLALTPVVNAATINVTTDSPTGPGSLTAAINALNNGDTIAFHIPPEAGEVHYIQTPADGYPLITKNTITIDGYTQGGASPNTASIRSANNAALKIVLTSTNGNALSMYHACTNSWGADIPRLGYGDDEQAILGFFHATNVWVKGLCIQANPSTSTSITSGDCKAICFAANSPENGGGMCQNFHVSGCWFGIDPVTKQVAYLSDNITVASPAICVASYRTRNAATGATAYNNPGTLGVAAGSANPRAEFNVWVTGYGFDSEGLNYRFSGNFFGVLPDGVTAADMGVLSASQQSDGFIEIGRLTSNITVGTDGDGVNDADEGNIFGPLTVGGVCMDFYSDPRTNIVVAGNYFGLDIHGHPFGATENVNPLIATLGTSSTFRFGSDFNGVGDAYEGNSVTNARLVAHDEPSSPSRASWVSMRGNSLQNSASVLGYRPPIGDGTNEHPNIYAGFMDTNFAFAPVVGGGTTAATLTGTCAPPAAGSPYTRLIVDLYEADTTPGAQPQGKRWLAAFEDNSAADANPSVGAFSFNTAGLGLTEGMKVTITVTYSKDTQPTISSISRAGNQTTLNVTGGTGPGSAATYGIQKSATVTGPYAYATADAGGLVTFPDNNKPTSFYRATGPAATGQTSPFSDVYTIAPQLAQQPQSACIELGSNVTFTVVASNAVSYQWLKEGSPIPGATTSTLTLTNISRTDVAQYFAVVTFANGLSTTSDAANLLGAVSPSGSGPQTSFSTGSILAGTSSSVASSLGSCTGFDHYFFYVFRVPKDGSPNPPVCTPVPCNLAGALTSPALWQPATGTVTSCSVTAIPAILCAPNVTFDTTHDNDTTLDTALYVWWDYRCNPFSPVGSTCTNNSGTTESFTISDLGLANATAGLIKVFLLYKQTDVNRLHVTSIKLTYSYCQP